MIYAQSLPLKAKSKIDSLFTDHDNLESPGYAIGIVKNGKALLKKGYGAANLEYNIPITEETTFSLASVSKRFTAACVAKLILSGKLSLETPVQRFIPELSKYALYNMIDKL